jgi:hypothetical protein
MMPGWPARCTPGDDTPPAWSFPEQDDSEDIAVLPTNPPAVDSGSEMDGGGPPPPDPTPAIYVKNDEWYHDHTGNVDTIYRCSYLHKDWLAHNHPHTEAATQRMNQWDWCEYHDEYEDDGDITNSYVSIPASNWALTSCTPSSWITNKICAGGQYQTCHDMRGASILDPNGEIGIQWTHGNVLVAPRNLIHWVQWNSVEISAPDGDMRHANQDFIVYATYKLTQTAYHWDVSLGIYNWTTGNYDAQSPDIREIEAGAFSYIESTQGGKRYAVTLPTSSTYRRWNGVDYYEWYLKIAGREGDESQPSVQSSVLVVKDADP